MTIIDKEALLEGIKEFLRTMILALLVASASFIGIVLFGIDTKAGTFDISWNVAFAVFLFELLSPLKVALLKAGDKWLHEKDVKSPLDLKGMDVLIHHDRE